jgi:hypothetical protein
MYSKLWIDLTSENSSGNNISEHSVDNFRKYSELNSGVAAWVFDNYEMVLDKNKTLEIDDSHG